VGEGVRAAREGRSLGAHRTVHGVKAIAACENDSPEGVSKPGRHESFLGFDDGELEQHAEKRRRQEERERVDGDRNAKDEQDQAEIHGVSRPAEDAGGHECRGRLKGTRGVWWR